MQGKTYTCRGGGAGGTLMLLFFVTIGAAAGSPGSLLNCGWLAVFMSVQLAVHLLVVLGVGKLAGIPCRSAIFTFDKFGCCWPMMMLSSFDDNGSIILPAFLT